MLNLNGNNMKNIKIYLIAIMIVICGSVYGQSYSFKVQDCGWFVMYNYRNPMMTLDKYFQNDSSIDCLLVEPNRRVYEIDLDSMVFKTDGVITSRILEVYPDSNYFLVIRFQYLTTEVEGYGAIQNRSDGKANYCAINMYESMPYIDGAIATGELVNSSKSKK